MSEYIHKGHNVSVLLYHYVCPAKYRRVIFDDSVDKVLTQTCQEISRHSAKKSKFSSQRFFETIIV